MPIKATVKAIAHEKAMAPNNAPTKITMAMPMPALGPTLADTAKKPVATDRAVMKTRCSKL